MSRTAKIIRRFRLLFIIPILIMTGCQPAFPEVEAAWITFTNQEYGYEFKYPSEARVEVTPKDASQVKVHIETDHPFEMTVSMDHSPTDVFHYLDTQASDERQIGENVWFEFKLPDGYCDAISCSEPIYALQMEWEDILYTATFRSQETTTELQEEILATFKISGKP
jgi:uncharacterized protein YwqG